MTKGHLESGGAAQMPSVDRGILLCSRFYETISDKADSQKVLLKKTPQKLVAFGV